MEKLQKPADPGKVHFKRIRARVDKVFVDGLARSKDDFVLGNVDDLFRAENFEQVIMKAHLVRNRLESCGCFGKVGVFIDVSSGAGATPDGVNVTFTVEELKRVMGGVNTLAGDNEGSLVVSLNVPNICGRGELFQLEYGYSTRKTTGFHITTKKPFAKTAHWSTSVYKQGFEWPSSGFGQIDQGLLFEVGFNSVPSVRHSLQWEGVWREISCLSRTTSFDVREHCGHSLKSALRHILTVDNRENSVFPSSGALLKFTSEVAGLGGDVSFLRNNAELQVNLPLPFECVLQGTLQGGLLKPLREGQSHKICDSFFLGGPLNLRGFEMRGVGPHSDGNSLGAMAFWAAGLHLYTPLPFRPGKGGLGDLFRTHFFVNTGNIGNWTLDKDVSENLQTVLNQLRVAYGVGLAINLGQVARVELNYCIPVSAQKGDKVNPGLQFGVGVNFI